MRKRMKQKLLCSFIFFLYVEVELVLGAGHHHFPDGFPNDHCFEALSVAGCKGTLLDDFKPTVKSVGPNKPDTQILLFTRSNKDKPEFMHKCGKKLPDSSKFNSKSQTVMIVHDVYDGACRTPWMRKMKDQLLIRREYNVILVDWTWSSPKYSLRNNIAVVSEQLAYIIKNLMKNEGVDGDQLHVIGHGIGSVIAGFVGRMLQMANFKKLRRITGLDPSCIKFGNSDKDYVLKKSDAQLVDGIHTNEGGDSYNVNFGVSQDVGHMDFYVNQADNGQDQPSCIPDLFTSNEEGEHYYAYLLQDHGVCNHYQSINYFIESINACECQFVGFTCNNQKRREYTKTNIVGKHYKTQCFKGYGCSVMGMDWESYPPDNKNRTIEGEKKTILSVYRSVVPLLCHAPGAVQPVAPVPVGAGQLDMRAEDGGCGSHGLRLRPHHRHLQLRAVHRRLPPAAADRQGKSAALLQEHRRHLDRVFRRRRSLRRLHKGQLPDARSRRSPHPAVCVVRLPFQRPQQGMGDPDALLDFPFLRGAHDAHLGALRPYRPHPAPEPDIAPDRDVRTDEE